MDMVIGALVAVFLQLWQEFVPAGTKVVLSMTTLRVVVPLLLTILAIYLVNRLYAHWYPAQIRRS